jgi:hypothetical protein
MTSVRSLRGGLRIPNMGTKGMKVNNTIRILSPQDLRASCLSDREWKCGAKNCENCGKPLGLSQDRIWLSVWFTPSRDPNNHKMFTDLFITCPNCEVPLSYDIPLDRFLDEGPAHWMAHLTEKTWFNSQLALAFFNAMRKLREINLV